MRQNITHVRMYVLPRINSQLKQKTNKTEKNITSKLEARIPPSVFNLFADIKTITLLCSVKACRLCQNSIICLHLAVFCSHFCYQTFSLTKTNVKKRGEKIIFFQLGYFIHLWSGFSVFPTDVNPSPCTVVSSHAKGKKKAN